MSTERFQRADQIFSGARALPAEARGDFVARACGEDAALREQVLSLLTADESSRAFMASTAIEALAQSVAAEGWSLQPGERVGAYTVVQRIGAGGAGEVWRARDERLSRDVAIKVLLPHFSIDPDRLRRFADEARAAGALNHSNILTVYDVGDHEGIPFLVSECLEGQSLRQRINARPIRIADVLSITTAIARGLAAAHARGIVHRDLKPENVFVRSDGGIKILDFGLAKLQSSLEDLSGGSRRTMTGVIIGTAGYMAPEQIRDESVDGRADLFALGVMLYEMLAGQRLFRRASTFETLHAVLTDEPPPVSTLNPQVAPPLDHIASRLIEKAPEARFQSALDLIWALEQAASRREAISAPPAQAGGTPGSRRSRLMPWIVAPILTALLLLSRPLLFSTSSPGGGEGELTRFTWTLPAGIGLGSAPVVSPDSRRIAFVGLDASSSRLYVRDRGSADAVPIAGTERAQHPFWSPDSASIGYFAGGRVMKVAWPGGAPVPLADAAPFPFGAAWSRSGSIIYAPDVIMSGLRRVGAGGGSTEAATRLDLAAGDTTHTWPVFLPDGRHFLYFVRSEKDERRGVYLGRIDDPGVGSLLLRSDSNVVYVPPPDPAGGVLLYSVNNRVEARRFDSNTMQLAGDATTIAGLSAAGTTLTQPAMLSATSDVLAFATGTIPYGNRIEAVDRQGQSLRTWNEPEAQNWPRLSPNGRFLARQRVHGLRNTPDIWVEDLDRGTNVRVTTAVEPDIRPVWSPDGRLLAYVSGNLPFRAGKRVLSVARADGTGVVRTYSCPSDYCEPTDWTSRGLLVNVLGSKGADVWVVPVEDGASAQPLLTDAFTERDARLSRDGRWVAYVSDESGRPEVSVRSLSGAPKRMAISGAGGDQPVWRADGSELFFIDRDGYLRSVPVRWSADREPVFGLPAKLNVPRIGLGHWGTPYDVSADGSRIYFLRHNEDPPPHEIHVVIGWRTLLR